MDIVSCDEGEPSLFLCDRRTVATRILMNSMHCAGLSGVVFYKPYLSLCCLVLYCVGGIWVFPEADGPIDGQKAPLIISIARFSPF